MALSHFVIRLLWVTGHKGIAGNPKAFGLARKGCRAISGLGTSRFSVRSTTV